jgi:nucleoside-diphosphate-sugar epimerase
MKIFITGAGGFLGKRIVKSLLEAKCNDLVLGIRQAKSVDPLKAVTDSFPQANVRLVQANLMNPSQLADAFDGVDMIIHCAAGMKGAPADMFMNSVIASRNMLDAAVAAKVKRIVLISSFAVYNTSEIASNSVVDESTPIEPNGVSKGIYAYAKVQQENLFVEYQRKYGFESIIIRPGVIFGPGGGGLSSRVGIGAFGRFSSLGGNALLPLTYVDNCADAVVHTALHAPSGTAYNSVDDDIPTCKEFLSLYRKKVEPLKVVPLPYPALLWASKMIEGYHKKSKGQLPAVLTPYVVKSMFRPFKYSNSALKAVGWKPKVSMEESFKLTLVPKSKAS